MRMTTSWSGSERTYRIQVCGVKLRPNGELPSDLYGDIQQSSSDAVALSRLDFPRGASMGVTRSC